MTTSATLPQNLVACLAHQGLSSEGLYNAIHLLSPHSKTVTVFPQHLRRETLKKYDILVLPGIIGEDSPYPQILSQNKMDQIIKTVEEDGLTVWTSCAATYYLFDRLSYLKRNGQKKEFKGAGIIKGYAEGPAYTHLTRRNFNNAAHHDLVLAQIAWPDQHRIFRLLDINGPALHLVGNNGLTREFLYYANVPQNPTAGFVKQIGKGKIVGLSFHPELTLHHPNLPQSHKHHEPDRITFLKLLRQEILTPKEA